MEDLDLHFSPHIWKHYNTKAPPFIRGETECFQVQMLTFSLDQFLLIQAEKEQEFLHTENGTWRVCWPHSSGFPGETLRHYFLYPVRVTKIEDYPPGG